jgi:hypothetical protein
MLGYIRTHNDPWPCEHLPKTSSGVAGKRALEIVLGIEAGIVIDIGSHVIIYSARGPDNCGNVVGEIVNARHFGLRRRERSKKSLKREEEERIFW